MNDIKKLKELIALSIYYNNYLRYTYMMDELGLGEEKFDFDMSQCSKEDLLKLKLASSTISLSFQKDNCMDKLDKNTFKSKVVDEYLEKAALMVSKKVGDKYIMGPFEFDSNAKVIDIVRNKLTHGDYYIDEDSITFSDIEINNNPTEFVSVAIDDISRMAVLITMNQMYQLNNQTNRNMVMGRIDENINLNNRHEIQNVCKKLYILKFVDYPEKGKNRDIEYIKNLNTFYEIFKNLMDSNITLNPNENVKIMANQIMNRVKPFLKEHGINLKLEVQNLYDGGAFTKIRKEFELHNDIYNRSRNYKINILMLIAKGIIEDNLEQEKIRVGAANNLIIIDQIMNQRAENEVGLIPSTDTFLDDITICCGLSTFYSLYQYGLENTYSNSNKTKLEEVINGKYLDFSLLNLSPLYDKEMKIHVSFSDFKEQYNSIEKDYLIEKNKLNKVIENKKKYLEKNSDYNIETLNKLENNINNQYLICKDKEELYLKAMDFMTRFNQYVINYNILLNMRDSIAHGNYKLISGNGNKCDPLLDAVLVFNNYYDNKCNYNIKIAYRDFINIFNSENVYTIIDYIDNLISKQQIENKTKIKK